MKITLNELKNIIRVEIKKTIFLKENVGEDIIDIINEYIQWSKFDILKSL